MSLEHALNRWGGMCAATAMVTLTLVSILCGGMTAQARSRKSSTPDAGHFYLPGPADSKEVTVTAGGPAAAEVIVLTEGVATKETGPKATVKKFGEVYQFAPSFIAVHRDQPTKLTFWNLQGDDEHDFMLVDPQSDVLMHVRIAPLTKRSWVFTFHDQGLFNFYCTMHKPEMSGQILVLPPNRPE